MAPRRRDSHRSAVVDRDGRRVARVILAVETIVFDGEDAPASFARVRPWLGAVSTLDAPAPPATSSGAAIIIDPFALTLHLTRGDAAGDVTVTHDGDEFLAAAIDGGIDLYVTSGIEPRRTPPAELERLANDGAVLGAHLAAFPVDAV